MKILMCPPTYFDVNYSINPWMTRKRAVKQHIAKTQWQSLMNLIVSLGAEVELMQPQKNLPDMVFTANAGLIYKNQVIISDFKYPERQGESQVFKEWFVANHFDVIDAIDTFEGAGDGLFVDSKLVLGSGFRSQADINQWITKMWSINPIAVELINPYFYHLDTCICPINETKALWFPPAFSNESQKKLKASFELIDVTEHDANLFACNAVVIDDHIILSSGCKDTATTLEKIGFETHFCETSEFILSGGSCKCLTLRLDC
jgi:N-dimethylarginine dimethylaminohydrolase